MDGYLSNALAFLDLNGNEKHDADEPSASTNERGLFSLSATAEQKASASVVIQAIAGQTTDMDQPGAPLSVGMTLIAPAGKPEVVSPLTTRVADTMRRENKTLDQAKASVAAELGLSAEVLMQDFVANSPNGSPSDAYKVAVAMAEVLKSVPANADKDARMGHVETHMGSVTDAGRLSEIKSSDLSAIRALVKDKIAQNTLKLSLNDKWLKFLGLPAELELPITAVTPDNFRFLLPQSLTLSPSDSVIELKLGSLFSRIISFSDAGIQGISSKLGERLDELNLIAISPQMPSTVAAGNSANLFTDIISPCAKSTGTYAIEAASATSLTVKLTISSEQRNGCTWIPSTEIYRFKLTESKLTLQDLTVSLLAQTVTLSF